MTWLCITLGVSAGVSLIGWVLTPLLGRRRILRSHVRDRFVVTLKTGETFSALLSRHDAVNLEFVDAKALIGGKWTPADGLLVLERRQVAYMQRIALSPGDGS